MNFPDEIKNRVQNMAIFFVSHTENVNRMKLNKLFYFADKMAIEKTAFSLSDQEYFADDNGPVPVSIQRDKNIIPSFDLDTVITESSDGIFKVAEGISFSDDEFNDEELEILQLVSDEYKTMSGQKMSSETHKAGEPWAIVWDNKKGKGKTIPLTQLLEDGLPQEEKERRRLLREDAQKSFDAFSRLRMHMDEAKRK